MFYAISIEIRCSVDEFSVLQPPSGQTCGGESVMLPSAMKKTYL
jgi:hypothetical protein